MKRYIYRLILAIAFSLIVGQAKRACADPTVLTFGHFTSTDHSYKNIQAAETLLELTQSRFETRSDVVWVERERIDQALKELGLASYRHNNSSTSLQLGKWLKADLLTKGMFSLQENKLWQLDLEIIDLQHADVLQRRSLSFGKESLDRLPVSEKLVDDIAKNLQEMLTLAVAQRNRLTDQLLVAPLYFQNVHKNSRLDFFERDLQRAFAKQNQRQEKYRYLQFPRSQDAYAEAELAASGIVEAEHGEWQRIADYYVWGSYQEIESSGVPFDEVGIEVNLMYWDGSSQRGKFTLRGTAGGRKELIQRIVEQVESIAVKKPLTAVNSDIRESIAEGIYERYLSRQIRTLQTERQSSTHVTKRWLRFWEQAKRQLSVAAFFAPTNEKICRELLIETTRDDMSYSTLPNNHEFWRLWRRHQAWVRHCEIYGFHYQHQRVRTFKSRPGAMGDNRLFHTNLVLQCLDAIEDTLAIVDRELRPNSVSPKQTDAPDALLKQWRNELSQVYLIQLRSAAKNHSDKLRGFARARLDTLRHFDLASSKAEFLELLWPNLIKNPHYTAEHLDRRLKEIYTELGKPEVAIQMLADVRKGKDFPPKRTSPVLPRTQNTSPSYRLKIGPIAPIHKVPSHPQSVDKWWTVRDVTALTHAGGQVWTCFSGSKRSTPFIEEHAIFSWDELEEKWLVWKTLSRDGTQTTSMLEQDGYLWFTFVGEDVMRIKLESGQTKRFSDRLGVPSQKLHTSCRCGNTLYFAGGEAAQGVLGAFDLSSEQWTEFDLGMYQIRGKEFPVPCVKKLAGNVQWLAVYANRYGSSNQILLFDQKKAARVDIGKMLQQTNPEFSHFNSSWRPKVHGMTFAEGTLWIATSRGLLAFDTNRQVFTHIESLPYELTSVVRDGNKL